MEYAQVINKLNITRAKRERQGVLLCCEVYRIESFSLGFCDGRDVGSPRQAPVSCECSSSVLDDYALGVVICGSLVVEKWSRGISGRTSLAESTSCQHLRGKSLHKMQVLTHQHPTALQESGSSQV